MLGRWDEVLAAREEFTPEQINSGGVVLSLLQAGVEINCHRGELDDARRLYSLFARLDDSTDVQDRSARLAVTAALRRAEGRLEEALEAGAATIETAEILGSSFQGVKHGVVDAFEAALALGNTERATELFAFVDELSPAVRSPYLDAHVLRLRARRDGDAKGLAAVAARFRALNIPFWLAVALVEQAEVEDGPEVGGLLAEAREIFERLGAAPWLERAGGARQAVEVGV